MLSSQMLWPTLWSNCVAFIVSPLFAGPALASFTRLHRPDARCVFGDGSVAREFPGAGHVEDGLARPRTRIFVKLSQTLLRLYVGGEVRQVHVVVPAVQQCIGQGRKDPRLVGAERTGEDQVQYGPRLRFVFVVPVRVVPAATGGHLLRGQSE